MASRIATSLLWVTLASAFVANAIVACAKGDASESTGPGTLGDAARGDGADVGDPQGDGSSSPADASTDSATQSDAASLLDPDLKLPGADAGGACTPPGTSCGGATVCRIATPTAGRCESCGPCGNLFAACTSSDQCDVLFQCYKGKCTGICQLGTSTCGRPDECIDVGHATHGVCKPP